VLIQTGGRNILVDPVWSTRVSPMRFVGPRRVNDPTLSRLAAAHAPRVITPLGNDTIMRAYDRTIAAEAHDWGDRVDLGSGMAVTLAPMRHWSQRQVFDRNKALWAAFIIDGPAGRIYHVGDSGYGEGVHFRHAMGRSGSPSCRSAPTSRAGSCAIST
jgi:L-ascorbate metabolism protein UlaG (beta-lactamase superfamily)